MDEIWHSLSYIGDTSSDAIVAEARAEAGSPWFSGHFPQKPILPGIAILSMVSEVIEQCERRQGRVVRIAGIRRVRFRLPVKPGELLKIFLSLSGHEKELSYHFRVEFSGKIVCTGIAVFEPLPGNGSLK